MIIGNYQFEDAWSKGVDCSYYRLANRINRADKFSIPSSAIIYKILAKPNNYYYLLHIQDKDLYSVFKSIMDTNVALKVEIDGYYFSSVDEAKDMFEVFLKKFNNLKLFL